MKVFLSIPIALINSPVAQYIQFAMVHLNAYHPWHLVLVEVLAQYSQVFKGRGVLCLLALYSRDEGVFFPLDHGLSLELLSVIIILVEVCILILFSLKVSEVVQVHVADLKLVDGLGAVLAVESD